MSNLFDKIVNSNRCGTIKISTPLIEDALEDILRLVFSRFYIFGVEQKTHQIEFRGFSDLFDPVDDNKEDEAWPEYDIIFEKIDGVARIKKAKRIIPEKFFTLEDA